MLLLAVLQLHPLHPTTFRHSTNLIQVNLASLTINQSPLTHTHFPRLRPYLNLLAILNLVWCQKNMFPESTTRPVQFNQATPTLSRLPTHHFHILRGIYLAFRLPWSIQTPSHHHHHQALVMEAYLQCFGRGSSWSCTIFLTVVAWYFVQPVWFFFDFFFLIFLLLSYYIIRLYISCNILV